MSWATNVLPSWHYLVRDAHREAMMLCAMPGEWLSGTSKYLPEHLIPIDKATFATHEFGGWNYKYTKEELKSLGFTFPNKAAYPAAPKSIVEQLCK